MASPIPKRGCRMKSVPMINAAPKSAKPSPRQKLLDNLRLKISHVPSATHNGEVLPSKVAFDAVVKEREAVHKPRSQAVNIPAISGKITRRERSDGFV